MDNARHQPVKVARLRRLGLYATGIFAALLIGFVPMWLVARTRANERDDAQQALRLSDLENTFSMSQRETMQSLLAQRDQMITLLARADPAVAERLADTYVSYRRAMGTLARPER